MHIMFTGTRVVGSCGVGAPCAAPLQRPCSTTCLSLQDSSTRCLDVARTFRGIRHW